MRPCARAVSSAHARTSPALETSTLRVVTRAPVRELRRLGEARLVDVARRHLAPLPREKDRQRAPMPEAAPVTAADLARVRRLFRTAPAPERFWRRPRAVAQLPDVVLAPAEDGAAVGPART